MNMKKSNSLARLLMAATATCLTLSSCWNNTTSEKNEPDKIVYDTLNFEKMDSTFSTHAQASFTANIIYPKQGPENLKRNIKEWTNEQLGGYYTYSLDTLEHVVDYYADMLIKNAIEELDEYAERNVSYTYDWVIQPVYETPRSISYQVYNYNFTGGAHGGRYITYATFRKYDGRIFGWDMIKHDSIYAVREMIRENIKTYFKVKTDEELKQYLFDGTNAYLFPLPVTPPVLTEEGVQFVYQQYEIAPYAAGNPTCTIPYEQIYSSLTSTAQQLTETEENEE